MNKEELISFRKKLHRIPELAMQERETSDFIKHAFQKLNPTQIIEGIAGTGLVIEFDTGRPGKNVMFRAELDALPIPDKIDFDYKSIHSGIGHKCGHDGHMTILYALAKRFLEYSQGDLTGKLQLIFQPGEETAQGAKLVVQDPKFRQTEPDLIFALHNLPGFPKNQVILREGTFASASVGVKISYTGETSHAGHPENGNSPVIPFFKLGKRLNNLVNEISTLSDYALVTIIHIKIGEVAFGTAPGMGVLMATLRSHENDDLAKLKEGAIEISKKIAEENNLEFEIEWVEEFPAIINNESGYNIISQSVEDLKMQSIIREKPFRWTEDFSYFLQQYDGAFFGLGSGTDHPQLHNSGYDFPDELIVSGSSLFFEIFKQINKE